MNNNNDEMILSAIDGAEALAYGQLFGFFDKNKGDFVSVKFESEQKIDLADEVLWVSDDYKKDPDELDDFTFELMTAVVGQESMKMEKEARDNENARSDIDKIISTLSEKEISSMVITLRVDGITEEYVSDEKAGEKYLSKEEQIDKIRETIKGFKNIVVVYSEEELRKLQEEYRQKQGKTKSSEDKPLSGDVNNKKETESKTQVYIRISEEDYEAAKAFIESQNIRFIANKVTTRDDKSGINMVIKAEDADKVRNIFYQNKISVLQDVDGNVDWSDIKKRSNKTENITIEQLREFQSKNNDKFDYIAFRKGDQYTVFTDKECNITIGSRQKTLAQIDETVKNSRKANSNSNETNKTKNIKEVAR